MRCPVFLNVLSGNPIYTRPAVCIKKVSNDAHAQPCANCNPNLGRVPCLVCLYIRPAVCIVTHLKYIFKIHDAIAEVNTAIFSKFLTHTLWLHIDGHILENVNEKRALGMQLTVDHESSRHCQLAYSS